MSFIYLNCWRCGKAMKVQEKNYMHGLCCGECKK